MDAKILGFNLPEIIQKVVILHKLFSRIPLSIKFKKAMHYSTMHYSTVLLRIERHSNIRFPLELMHTTNQCGQAIEKHLFNIYLIYIAISCNFCRVT